MEVEMEVEVEMGVEVEEGAGRIEYKVVVEQLERLSSKHRPNYLTVLFVQVLQDVSRFLSFLLFLFYFFKGEPRGEECLFNPVG